MPVFEDVELERPIASLVKGPISPAHIMRWSSAIENWHRIHYDRDYAVDHDKLPDIVINGSWKQHVLLQLLTDWAGETGWVWKANFQFRGIDVVNDTLNAWATPIAKQERGGFGLVSLQIGIRNGKDEDSTPGTATVVLPKRGGPPVPYPFDPKILDTGGHL